MIDHDIPKPTLEDSFARLRNLDEFRVVCEWIRQQREGALMELGEASDPNLVMKWSGVVKALDDQLKDFEGRA